MQSCEGFVIGVTIALALELALLDTQVTRQLRIVALNLLDEPLGVLVADERVDRSPQREVGREASSTTA
jgi:hypothetical protein